MKICYWGTYDPLYPRNRTLIDGLRKNGLEVVELNEPIWKGSRDKLARASSWWKSPGFLLRWAAAYFKLAFRLLREKDVDIIFVGYTGHFDIFAAKPLSVIKGVPLVFDTFLSLYEAFVADRAVVKAGSLKARLLYFADKYSCALADLALLDTDEHIKYFCSTFGLPASKFRRSFVGANEDFYGAKPVQRPEGPFTVLHFGTYIPLHGLKYVLRAAKELEGHSDIFFRLIGSGEEYAPSLKLAAELGLKNVEFVAFKDMPGLLEEISKASVCLGIFGDTEKALRVIPNKVFLALAMEKPVITGNSPAARELLKSGRDCLLCAMADPKSLSAAILTLKADRALALKLAHGGNETFNSSASVAKLGKELAELLEGLLRPGEGNTYKWMAGPRYLCRRRLVLRLIDEIKPKNILELGFGSGDLLKILSGKGYSGLGIDFSADAVRNIVEQPRSQPFNFRIENKSDKDLSPEKERFGLVMAFEVLEHIEDDAGSLAIWNSLLSHKGKLLLSVPAHMSKFDAADTFAGHIRRYEKEELLRKLKEAGFKSIKFYSYGYPFINLVSHIKALVGKFKLKKGLSTEQRTKESGQGFVVWKYGRYFINDLTMLPAYLAQDLFLNRDLGNGYLVLAEKTASLKSGPEK